ncbi:AAA family ATPase [Patescibacteria group bacterium AH-259-L05]|nr:AAA family ATPase [Patescibacteria group bacterium AH-259-L05]
MLPRKKKKQSGFELKDYCYVYNFDAPDKPKLLTFRTGEGKRFDIQIRRLLRRLKKDIPDKIKAAQKKAMIEYNTKIDTLEMEMERQLREKHFILVPREGSSIYIPQSMSLKDETKPMSDEERSKLSNEVKQEIAKKEEKVREIVTEFQKEKRATEKYYEKHIEELERKVFISTVADVFKEFDYSDNNVLEYLQGLRLYVLTRKDLFYSPEVSTGFAMVPLSDQQESEDKDDDNAFLPFKINVLVDNSRKKDPPIVFEQDGTFHSMFGRIDKKFSLRGYSTDHTMIRPGSLVLANGGYWIVQAEDFLMIPNAWKKLKKIQQTRQLRIDGDPFGSLSSVGLNPDPIPLDVKVIIIGDSLLYYLLAAHDQDFLNMFVGVEFDTEMKRDKRAFKSYAAFVSFCCEKENLLSFENGAVAKVIEHGMRLVHDQKKISTRFGRVKKLIEQSDSWARKAKSKTVKDIHVDRALNKAYKRINRIEERYQEKIKTGKVLIDVKGEKVGEINSLTVMQLSAEFSFGAPVKITALADFEVNGGGVISIQKKAGLSGSSYDKSVYILREYIKKQYGSNISVSICFEQTQGEIDGTSALLVMYLVSVSALSGLSIDQSWAVTGSMSQKGFVHPIGAVNQKIEGFFKACGRRLDGQKVMMPVQNVDELMLNKNVVEAAKKDQFHVYAISTADEAIELVFNRPSQEVHDIIKEKSGKKEKEFRGGFNPTSKDDDT